MQRDVEQGKTSSKVKVKWFLQTLAGYRKPPPIVTRGKADDTLEYLAKRARILVTDTPRNLFDGAPGKL